MPEKEYIEREALPAANMNDNDYADGWNECLEAINAIPSADVREVVYCRECKHYKPQEKKSARWDNRSLMCTRSATIKMPPDGFCSYGEKKEES